VAVLGAGAAGAFGSTGGAAGRVTCASRGGAPGSSQRIPYGTPITRMTASAPSTSTARNQPEAKMLGGAYARSSSSRNSSFLGLIRAPLA
jgi:hypothetical protein